MHQLAATPANNFGLALAELLAAGVGGELVSGQVDRMHARHERVKHVLTA